MNINWKTLPDQSYEGFDENGNRYRQPANQETTTVFLKDGRTGQGWTPNEAIEVARKKEQPGMLVEDLIKALSTLNPKSRVVINVKQYNKLYGFQLPIEYGAADINDDERETKGEYSHRLNAWVNNTYGGSITVHLPYGAYVVGLPEGMKPV
jgi:hypothetical protein